MARRKLTRKEINTKLISLPVEYVRLIATDSLYDMSEKRCRNIIEYGDIKALEFLLYKGQEIDIKLDELRQKTESIDFKKKITESDYKLTVKWNGLIKQKNKIIAKLHKLMELKHVKKWLKENKEQ